MVPLPHLWAPRGHLNLQPVFNEVFYLVWQFPLASPQEDFPTFLQAYGPGNTLLTDYISCIYTFAPSPALSLTPDDSTLQFLPVLSSSIGSFRVPDEVKIYASSSVVSFCLPFRDCKNPDSSFLLPNK